VSFSGILYSIYPPLFVALVLYSTTGTAVSLFVGKVGRRGRGWAACLWGAAAACVCVCVRVCVSVPARRCWPWGKGGYLVPCAWCCGLAGREEAATSWAELSVFAAIPLSPLWA